jgi:hypothetical protein
MIHSINLVARKNQIQSGKKGCRVLGFAFNAE